MRKIEIEYNTSRDELIMPEYGRHVQEMIQYAKSIPDLKMRQAYVEKIVDLMYIMNPQGKNVEDYRERLWKHAFQIAEYDLNGVVPPSGIIPTPDDKAKKPEKIDYPESEARFRHYGHYVQLLIKKAKEMEDGPIKQGLVASISSYMKLAYRTWNRDHYVSDEVIKADLVALSDGKLSMPSDQAIENLDPAGTAQGKRNGQPMQQQSSKQGGKKKKKTWKRK